MRKQSKKQKDILTHNYKVTGCHNVDELNNSVWLKLEAINDYETMYQDVNRYLMDLHFEGYRMVDVFMGRTL